MTIRPIRELGDPVLRTPSDEVTTFDGWLAALVRDLEETVDNPGRAGVAAPQIGVGLRVFTYNIDGIVGHLINPDLTLSDEEQFGSEGCLSFPGLTFDCRRALSVVARGFNQWGEPVLRTLVTPGSRSVFRTEGGDGSPQRDRASSSPSSAWRRIGARWSG